VRQKMDEADLRKKTETNAFADFLSRVLPTGQASKVSPPLPTPQTTCRGTQTDVTSASVTTSPLLIPTTAIKEFKYDHPKQERVGDDDEYASAAAPCSLATYFGLVMPYVYNFIA